MNFCKSFLKFTGVVQAISGIVWTQNVKKKKKNAIITFYTRNWTTWGLINGVLWSKLTDFGILPIRNSQTLGTHGRHCMGHWCSSMKYKHKIHI